MIEKFSILFRSIPGGEECLGFVASPDDIKGDALPVGGYVREEPGVSTSDGVAFSDKRVGLVLVPAFTPASFDSLQTKIDDAIVALPADVRAKVAPDFKTEAEKKAERAAAIEAAEAKRLAEADAVAEVKAKP